MKARKLIGFEFWFVVSIVWLTFTAVVTGFTVAGWIIDYFH